MTTMTPGADEMSVDQYAQEAVNRYYQQQGQQYQGGQQGPGGRQVSPDEQARFLKGVGKWFAENALPAVLPVVQNLLAGQQRALGMPETRGGEEESRFLLDFAKKALKFVAPVAQSVLKDLLQPRQRDINEDAQTTDRFAFLAPFIPAIISAAGGALGAALSGRRGPLTVDAEQDRLILSQFTTNCWNSMLRPEVLNSVKPIVASVQQPSGGMAPSIPQQPQQPQQPQPQPQPQSQVLQPF